MNVTTISTTAATSEFAFLATICQGYESVADHTDAETKWFTNFDYQIVLEALRELADGQFEYDVTADIVVAYLEQTGRHADKSAVYELFNEPVSGTTPEFHKKILRLNWEAQRLLEVRADIERAAKNGTIETIRDLTAEAAALEAGTSQKNTRGRGFGGIAAVDLWPAALEPVEWLVTDVLSADQPTIFGAKQKSLKTTLLTDLSISLATGYPWLNKFEIPNKHRILVITGEASEKAAIRKVRRAAERRNLRPENIGDNIRIETTNFPTLPMLEDCVGVQDAVANHSIDVVILDPLYMGLEGLNTANLTEVGPAMRRFMQHCRPAKVIIAHHVKKSASFDDAPNLEDLSQAGIAEFAGNYWLMGRMSEYQGDGKHQLAVRYGGRDEQFGLLKLDFDERHWTSHFTNLQDHRDFEQQREENSKITAMKQRVLKELDRYQDGISESGLATATGTKPQRSTFQDALAELEERKSIVCITDFKSSNKRVCKGWRLAE